MLEGRTSTVSTVRLKSGQKLPNMVSPCTDRSSRDIPKGKKEVSLKSKVEVERVVSITERG